MAQLRHTLHSLNRRLGGKGAPIIAAVACIFAVGIGGVGILFAQSADGITLERGDGAGAEDAEAPDAESKEPAEEGGEADGADAEAAGEGEGAAAPKVTKVHVDGAVASPGVYELLQADPRVADAVAAAGGLSGDADTAAVNLAAQVPDASKVHIPSVGEAPVQEAESVAAVGEPVGTADASAAGVVSGSGSSASQGTSGGLVNLNTASAEELCELPGVGEATAANIIADREQNGPFTSVDDLMRVSGIGEKKLAKVRDLVCI